MRHGSLLGSSLQILTVWAQRAGLKLCTGHLIYHLGASDAQEESKRALGSGLSTSSPVDSLKIRPVQNENAFHLYRGPLLQQQEPSPPLPPCTSTPPPLSSILPHHALLKSTQIRRPHLLRHIDPHLHINSKLRSISPSHKPRRPLHYRHTHTPRQVRLRIH